MNLDDLKPGSIGGAHFLLKSSSITGGRKDQLHEFPNSDKQTIEDLGYKPRSYSLSVCIAAPDYLQKKRALLEVLESNKTVVLIHPIDGDVPNIKPRTFTINENLTELGRADLTITLDINDDTGLPKENVDVINNVESARADLSAAVTQNIEDNFNVTSSYQNNFLNARAKLVQLNGEIREKTSFIFKVQEGANEFNTLINDFSNNINELITQPATLADSMLTIFDSIDSLYVNSKDSFDVYKRFSDFGDDDLVLDVYTAGLVERDNNNEVVNASVQAYSLGYQYQNAAKNEFTNVEQIEQAEDTIEANYQKLINASGLDSDSVAALKELRTITTRFLSKEKLNVDRVTTIRTNLLPARVISYQYYEDSTIGELITELNSITDVSFVEDEIEIFTA